METYNTDVPGNLRWFDPGSDKYQSWVDQRNNFMKEIDKETPGGKELLNDILDSLLESEIPSGILSTISVALKITRNARNMHKRKQIWYKVIDAVIQLTFTAPSQQDDEFVLNFYQVQHLWRGLGGGHSLSPDDYIKLYSTIDTKLRVGKLKNRVINFPELDRYIGYKIRQFKDSFHRYQLSLIEQ